MDLPYTPRARTNVRIHHCRFCGRDNRLTQEEKNMAISRGLKNSRKKLGRKIGSRTLKIRELILEGKLTTSQIAVLMGLTRQGVHNQKYKMRRAGILK